jgi:outer membrane lipoprotein carrier protein
MNNTLKCFLVTSTLSLSLLCSANNNDAQDETLNTTVEKQQNISIAKQALMTRLSGFNHFSATFSQQVIDEEKNTLQEGQGKFAVKKPNLVYWETQQPEESLIVSDGQTLWFFDPFIEQATAYRVDASVANTPILLLTSSDEALWQKYSVTQTSSNNFLIHSNDINSRVKTLELNFLADSAELESFSILDSTGQLSLIKLGDVIINAEIASNLFEFTLPEGVYLDDQR